MTVFGGTGLVGGHLVRLLAARREVEAVRAPVRRPVPAWDRLEGVRAVPVEFDHLGEDAGAWAGDAVFLCLGSTIRKAGSEAAFRRVDFDYTVEAARLAAEHGARHAFLVSSVGADPDSRLFYPRVKGEAEQAVSGLPFRSVHLVRPALLVGDRDEVRVAESLGALVGSVLGPLMVGPLRCHRPIRAEAVARAMVALAADPGGGVRVHESEELRELASTEA